VKESIIRGVSAKMMAYVVKTPEGRYDPFVFGEALDPIEIDISDDTFIITAEEAKKHIEPPHLTSVSVSPGNNRIQPGKKYTYVATGYDQFGREFAVSGIEWKCTGGVIDENGVLTATEDEGSYIVEAHVDEVIGRANFVVSKADGGPPGDDDGKQPSDSIRSVHWNGEVPLQKWMNFYTKVLSKHAGSKGLTVKIHVDFAPDSGVTRQMIEELRRALRDLGLDEDLISS